ncbi:hypothetical protein [Actinobaculum suis]|uniref:Uncharacterized protein n=1 Tax=Actinobaculum suis TaxID=1657 RepID=A0AAW9HML4_9ACTO|nr:hypothetical protein [Actinobaculum suis]MDY5152938.1 hypothetical protein [Actinobaculum suis]
MLLVIVVLVGGAIWLVTTVFGKVTEHQESRAQTPQPLYEPVECTAAMLESSLGLKGGVVGAPTVFTLTLRNTSMDNPCFIDVGRAHVNVKITSGSADIAETAGCADVPESKILLLDRGMSATTEITWPGRVSPGTCASTGSFAQAGGYRAEASAQDGKLLLGDITFEMKPVGSRSQQLGAAPRVPGEKVASGEEAGGESSTGEGTTGGAAGGEGATEGEAPAGEDAAGNGTAGDGTAGEGAAGEGAAGEGAANPENSVGAGTENGAEEAGNG